MPESASTEILNTSEKGRLNRIFQLREQFTFKRHALCRSHWGRDLPSRNLVRLVGVLGKKGSTHISQYGTN